MRILLQRVTEAKVTIDNQVVSEIGPGLLLLTGFGRSDQGMLPEKLSRACDKVLNLRVFPNQAGKLDYSVVEKHHDVLVVPQFTLYGKSEKGRRPDFTDALAPELASEAFDRFAATLSTRLGREVASGRFGAEMNVSLVNDGPFTLMLEY